MKQDTEQPKVPFSTLAHEMGWNAATAKKVKQYVSAAQQIRPYNSYNAWARTLGRQPLLGDYLHYKDLLALSERLDGWVGKNISRFLGCDLEH